MKNLVVLISLVLMSIGKIEVQKELSPPQKELLQLQKKIKASNRFQSIFSEDENIVIIENKNKWTIVEANDILMFSLKQNYESESEKIRDYIFYMKIDGTLTYFLKWQKMSDTTRIQYTPGSLSSTIDSTQANTYVLDFMSPLLSKLKLNINY